MSVKAADIPFRGGETRIDERIFRERGEQRYSLELIPIGITFEVDRLARRSKELWGELRVTVNGHFSDAKTNDGGVLSMGDLNFSSVQARETRAKLLTIRSRSEHLDWHGFLEDFVLRVIDAERKGKPAVVLADVTLPEGEDNDAWDVAGLPILKSLPMVLFGSGGAAKSYLSMWIAGNLAKVEVPVLYADWEFSQRDHRKRLAALFQPMPKALFYVTCERPMADEVDRLVRLVQEHRIQYVVCDSMVFALNGPADDEHASIYFRAIRQLKVGTLNVAHTTKADDDREKQVYGSVFFQNGARSIWFAQRAENNPIGELNIGLYHRKSNVGELLQPKGFTIRFLRGVTQIERVDVRTIDELAAKMPLLDRMRQALEKGALTYKQLAEDVDSTQPVIRKIISRYKSQFVRLGPKVGLVSKQEEF